MARIKNFYVFPERGDFMRGCRGVAEVTWDPSLGIYHIEARTARNVLRVDTFRNESGFAHRQWECNSFSDNQFPTLRAVAQAALYESWESTRGREAAIAFGVFAAEPVLNPEFAA